MNRNHSSCLPITITPDGLKLVEDRIVFVKRAEFAAQVVVYGVCLDGVRLNADVPDLHRHVVPRCHVHTAVAETYVRNTGNNLGEEAAGRCVFFLFKH